MYFILIYLLSDLFPSSDTMSCSISCVYLPLPLGYLCVVEVTDHITFTYTGKAQSFEWLNRDFKMHFPENALPPEVDECHVYIKTSLSGQFDLPRDVFTQPVTLEIQHCVQDLQQQSSLTYVVASCSQEELPYQFKTLERGVFAPNTQYGSINLTHFSGLAIASQPHPRQSCKACNPQVRSYYSRLYYSSSGIHSWEVFFVIAWNLELHIAMSINY